MGKSRQIREGDLTGQINDWTNQGLQQIRERNMEKLTQRRINHQEDLHMGLGFFFFFDLCSHSHSRSLEALPIPSLSNHLTLSISVSDLVKGDRVSRFG